MLEALLRMLRKTKKKLTTDAGSCVWHAKDLLRIIVTFKDAALYSNSSIPDIYSRNKPHPSRLYAAAWHHAFLIVRPP